MLLCMLEAMRRVLLCMLKAVYSGLCLLEVLVTLELLKVMRRVLLCPPPATKTFSQLTNLPHSHTKASG